MNLSAYRYSLIAVLALAIWLVGCTPKGEDAKKQLELKGIKYSQASFFKAVTEGRADIVLLFLDAGIDIRARLLTKTPIMVASTHGRSEVTRLLLDRGAEVNVRDDRNCTALMLAMEHAAPNDLIELLRSKGGTIELARDHDRWVVKGSEANFKNNMLEVVGKVENRSMFAALYPSFELTITDRMDRPVERRIFPPGQYIAGDGNTADRLPAKTTMSIKITTPNVEHGIGYRLYLFYPDQ